MFLRKKIYAKRNFPKEIIYKFERHYPNVFDYPLNVSYSSPAVVLAFIWQLSQVLAPKEGMGTNQGFGLVFCTLKALLWFVCFSDLLGFVGKTDLQRERERSSICWLTPQMAPIARAEAKRLMSKQILVFCSP